MKQFTQSSGQDPAIEGFLGLPVSNWLRTQAWARYWGVGALTFPNQGPAPVNIDNGFVSMGRKAALHSPAVLWEVTRCPHVPGQDLLMSVLLLLRRFSRVRLVRPYGRQPTRLPCPWDSPGKNTGVGCHFLLQCVKVKSLSRVRLLATPWTACYYIQNG